MEEVAVAGNWVVTWTGVLGSGYCASSRKGEVSTLKARQNIDGLGSQEFTYAYYYYCTHVAGVCRLPQLRRGPPTNYYNLNPLNIIVELLLRST